MAKRPRAKKVTPSEKLVRLTFFTRIVEVLGNTEKYFAGVKNERYDGPLLYYLPFMIIGALLGAFTLPGAFSLPLSAALFLLFFIGEIALQLGALFFVTWLTQLCLRMCKGQGEYLDTFKVGVYASTPVLLWNVLGGLLALVLSPLQAFWLFFPSMAFMIWGICLEVMGLAQYHKISSTRAFWGGIALPLAIIFAAIMVIVFTLFVIGIALVVAVS